VPSTSKVENGEAINSLSFSLALLSSTFSFYSSQEQDFALELHELL
jgi:hypothetical protein